MEEGIGRNEQFQELKKKLAKEYNRLRNETKIDHVSFFRHWVERVNSQTNLLSL
jgi:hypothetical protein